MSGEPSEGKKHHRQGARLGSLSSDTDPSAGRLGNLRMSMPVKQETDGGGPTGASGGRTAVTHGGSKKKRFAPLNTARRKVKEDPDGAGPSGSRGGMAADAFQDLITQAQTDIAGQARGIRGRGRGRGRGYGQQRHQVVFGGTGGMPSIGGAAVSASAGGGGGGGGGGGPGGTGGGGGGGGGAGKAKGPIKLDADGNVMIPQGEGSGSFLNPDQYYPTLLPLVPAGMEEMDREAEEEMVVPPDLASVLSEGSNAAEEMGLLNSLEDDRLLLFQLPNVLPVSNPKAAMAPAPAQNILAPEAPPEPACLSLSSLPAGKIGKLLVFESGKVKMQIGKILLDVDPGVPCVFRQDVAAMNAEAGHAVFLGDVAQRVVCAPDIGMMLADQEIPDWERRLAGLSLGKAEPTVKTDVVGQAADMDVDEKKDDSLIHLTTVKHEDDQK